MLQASTIIGKTKINRKRFVESDLLYLVGYALVLFRAFISTTAFHWYFPASIELMIRLCGYILILLRLLIKKKVRRKHFYFGIAMLAISFISVFQSNYLVLLDYAVCCVFAIDVDFNGITRVYVIESLVMTLITIVSALVGLINNYIYIRTGTGAIRMSLGFVYPTDFAAHVFYIFVGITVLCYSKINWKFVVAYGMMSYITYRLTDARGPSIMILVLGIVVFVYKKLGEKGTKALPDSLLQYGSVICAALTMLMIHFYDANNESWRFINSFTTNRLAYAQNIMKQNTITLFGQYIEQRGDGEGGRLVGQAYTYIDLSFQRVLLMYGIVLLVFILLYSVLLFRKSKKSNNFMIPLLLFIIAVYSMTSQHYFDFSYNFILLAYFAKITSYTEKHMRKNRDRILTKDLVQNP